MLKCRAQASTTYEPLGLQLKLDEELKAKNDQAKEHIYLVRTITRLQAIPRVKNCAAMKGLIASSELQYGGVAKCRSNGCSAYLHFARHPVLRICQTRS